MTISLENHVVVVTGGAKRLGKAVALECARSGAEVAITYRNSREEALKTLEELRQIAPQRRFEAYQLEVSDARAVEEFAAAVWRDFGHATDLVNCAAIFERTPFGDLSEKAFDEHVNANLKGPFLLSKAFGERFLPVGGAIVNFADIFALRPLANYAPYCASKAGLVMLTQSLAKALAPRVRVNCVCPGTILPPSETEDEIQSSGMNDTALKFDTLIARIPMQRFGTPLEVAQCVVFLLGGPAFVTGAILNVDGGQILR